MQLRNKLLPTLLVPHEPAKRLFAIKLILAFAIGIPLLITKSLFFSDRFYPLLPVASIFGTLPRSIEVLWFYGNLALLLGLAFRQQARTILLCLVTSFFVWGLFDQNRLMPYYYQFFFMLLALCCLRWKDDSELTLQASEFTLRLILVSIYFWSGFHKLNVRYIFLGFPWLVSEWTPFFGETIVKLLPIAAVGSALVELGIGLLLLFPGSRRWGVTLGVLMHGLILALIGPLGMNWNESVWSWNIAMMFFLVLLFWNSKEGARTIFLNHFAPSGIVSRIQQSVHATTLLLFLALPAVNSAGRWDDFLSHAMYTWSTEQGFIEVGNLPLDLFPAEVQPHILVSDGIRHIDYVSWAYGVYRSSPFYSHRLFLAGFKKVCGILQDDPQLRLVLLSHPDRFVGDSHKAVISCRDLR